MPAPEGSLRETLTDAAKDGLLDLAAEYVTAGLGDFLYATTELPQFLADESPVTAPAVPLKEITRLACRAYARGGGPQNLPGFDAAWGGICGPYLDSIGEAPLPGEGVSAPFSGGQCPGVNYKIDWSWSAPGFNSGPQTANRTGPLGFSRAGTGSLDCGSSGATYNVYTMTEGTGNNPVSLAAGCGAELNGLTVTRLDGLPDDCGGPPVEYDPPKVKPGLPTLPPSTPIDFPGVGPIGVDITFDPDGTINVNLPDIGVEVGIEDPFGLSDDGGDEAPPGGPPPGDVGEPGSPVGVGAGGEEEGQAPEGSVLVGLRVQIVTVPDSRTRYTPEVLRGAYYAYMGVPGLLDLDFGGSMVRQDQFLFAEKENLTNWRIKANNGYELITTPYYRQVEV